MSPVIRVDVGPIAFTEDDHEFVLGAYIERRRAAEANGRVYHLTDFVRDALIEVSHR